MRREKALKRKIITRDDLRKWFERIGTRYDLYAPVRSTAVNFEEIKEVERVCLDFTQTLLPAKVLFFPQSEELFSYARDSKGVRMKTSGDLKKERILFGIRPCDVRALSILDMVFGGKLQDTYYLEKREKTVLIGVGCTEPLDNCFCTSFGIDPLSGQGTDIFLVDKGDYYTVKEVNTERGRSLVDFGGMFFTKEQADSREEVVNGSASIDIKKVTGNIGKVREDFWNETSDPCLSCGICTYVCPTCHCFDVEDEEKQNCGVRYRFWDFCMGRDFARMASGENPRVSKGERYRHRYFHKLEYFPKKHEVIGCVGCGRCISYCPVNMDIRKVLDDILESIEE